MSLKLQQLAVRGKVPRDVRESCLTGPGCAGTREHIRGGKKEKGNRIKGKSSLNTKGGLGKSSTPSRQRMGQGCPGLSSPAGTVTPAGCGRGQGHLAGAEGWHFSSRLSTAVLDRCVSLGGFASRMGSAVSPGWQFSCQSHLLL